MDKYGKKLNKSTKQLQSEITKKFDTLANKIASDVISKYHINPNEDFSFDKYPKLKKDIDGRIAELNKELNLSMVNGINTAWDLSTQKNDALAISVLGKAIDKLSKSDYQKYFTSTDNALQSFIQRKTNGLDLSQRIWKYTDQFKGELELALEMGIKDGLSAPEMSRNVRQYLKEPTKLFRRVRDEKGDLHLSKNAKLYHSGQGVYRSSYMNARRLAVTETNMAYHTADYERWQAMDFVVGIKISLSSNHTTRTPKGRVIALTDMCDELQGEYPKDFKFTGWHPHCRCTATSILKTKEELKEDTERILQGKRTTNSSVNKVKNTPKEFNEWIKERKDKITISRTNGKEPYFLKDNKQIIDDVLGLKPKTTDSEETAKTLINLDKAIKAYRGKDPELVKNETYINAKMKKLFDDKNFSKKNTY